MTIMPRNRPHLKVREKGKAIKFSSKGGGIGV